MAVDNLARAMAAHADSKAVTAYQYAVEGGYTGTEQEFEAEVALMAQNAQAVNNAVRFDLSQSKTDSEKLQAQSNIGVDTTKGALQAQMDEFAKQDGYYSGLTSGQTEQILSNKKSFNKVPYLSRTTGGSADVGARETVKNVVYGTVVHNQLIQNGNFSNGTTGWTATDGTISVSDNILTLTPSAVMSRLFAKINIVDKHKYLRVMTVKGDGGIASMTWYGGLLKDVVLNGTWQTCIDIIENTSGTTAWNCQINLRQNTNLDTLQVKNVMIIDLTQYFGSSQIPDYLHSLEQASTVELPNQGINQLHQWGFLRRPYYAYDTGTPKSSNPSYKTNTNRNLWNEKWELGSLDDNGAKSVATNKIRSEELFRVLPNSTYGMSAIPQRICGYDANKNFVGLISVYSYNEYLKKFNTPDNVYYLMFSMASSYGTTYKNDICIYYYWDTDFDDDPYVAHEEWTYPIDSSVVGHGIFKLDANNNLYIDGDTLASDGTNTTNYGYYTITGEEAFSTTGAGQHILNGVTADTLGAKYPSDNNILADVICSFTTTETYQKLNISGTTTGIGIGQNKYIIVGSTEYANWSNLAGKKIWYKLATPTTSQKEPYTETQTCDDWGIQYTNDKAFDDGNSDVEVPVGFDSEFPANLVAKLEMSPDSPSDGDGDYIVRQTDGQNEYVKLVIPQEVPSVPTTDGNYVLKVVVSGGTGTPTWVAET